MQRKAELVEVKCSNDIKILRNKEILHMGDGRSGGGKG